MATVQTVDIAIVGGGPAGLAVAVALRARCPDLSLRVHERGSSVPVKGAGLALHPNGLAALQAVSPELCAKLKAKAYIEPVVFQVVDKSDQVLQQVTTTADTTMRLTLPWYELTKTMADELPDELIVYNHALSDIQLPAAGSTEPARLTFTNGAVHEAKVVLGCDGLQSLVRQVCMPSFPEPGFQNMVTFRGRVPTEELKKLPSWTGEVAGRSYPVGGGPFGMVYTVSADVHTFVMNVPFDTVQAKGVAYVPYGGRKQLLGLDNKLQGRPDHREDDAHTEALKVMDLYPESMQQAVRAGIPATCTINGTYGIDAEQLPSSQYGSGPVAILGDAAHALPVAGQGANLALEDAAVLAYYIHQHGPCEAALRAYEADRAPRIRRIADHLQARVTLYLKEDGKGVMKAQKEKAKGGAEYDPEVHGFEHPCLHN